MIESLNIKNYRMFRDFNIPKLARINLIGGNNNCGKTSFLEAIRLLESKFGASVLYDIIRSRGDIGSDTLKMYSSIYSNKNDNIKSIVIGNFIMYVTLHDNTIIDKIRVYDYQEYLNIKRLQDKMIPHFTDKNQVDQFFSNDYISEIALYNQAKDSIPNDKAIYIPFTIESKRNDEFWKKTVLTPREDDVLKILQIIEPKIKKFSIIEGNGTILIEGEDEPRPLKNLGDGANRILTIALALVNAKDKALLIDEFEVGLHYSAQEKLWDIIFEYAKLWNVQVFVTTHSLDTLRSFRYVCDRYEGEGQYFRLSKSRQNADIEAVKYDKETLQTAIDENYEPR